ncbi:retropepsin-like aspartic protease [Sphingopyxis sp. JAI108]|uniref:retropepsin-like aspartic protease n=1 Tax=Sphingopyxis sp. JAI108 TaxID=2723060 RepID=UPI0015C6C0C4|nr:retropepsin-like aspartic protease [Sphingopyxis sp. JAI108]NYF30610.1 hypothetical protein [Sphingopyxis sp. JAI108]
MSVFRPLTLTGAVLVSSIYLPGDGSARTQASAASLEATAERADSGSQALPFELTDNLVRIEVEVNGQKRSGVLDSGAGAILIDRKASRELGLDEGAPAGDAAGAGSEVRQLLPVTLGRLTAGPLTFEGVEGYAIDLGHLTSSAQFPVDVLLGAPAFQNRTVSVDYARKVISFGSPGTAMECAAPIALELVHNVPVVEIEVEPASDQPPVRLKVLVDLGTRHSALVLGGPFVRSDAGKALALQGRAKEIGHGVGGRVQGAVVSVPEVRAGGTSFGPLEISMTSEVPAFENGTIDGTLGVPLWNGGVISFDYPARQLCITRK